jgi:galactonate dehydratase
MACWLSPSPGVDAPPGLERAEAFYVQMAPYNPQGSLSTAAAAHLAIAIPNFLILEYVRQEPDRDQLLREAWTVKNGHLHGPGRPGLGVELDEGVIAAQTAVWLIVVVSHAIVCPHMGYHQLM